jgi:hypothetical protein
MRPGNRLWKLAVAALVLAGLCGSVWGDDGFYVIPVKNRNIITTDTNTAIGKGAFNATSTGSSNTASGTYVLHANTSGNSNTANGANALHCNTTGSYNTASGLNVLYYNTTGNYNTGCGGYALYYNITGNNNTACGYAAFFSNTTGNENTAAGYAALGLNDTGNYNTAVGTYALYTSRGHGNTALGQNAGYNRNPAELFTGNANIYIGQDVGPGSLTESNTIRIGNSYQSKTFVAGIASTYVSSAVPVYVKSDGQLGTVTSSHRYKDNIQDMGEASSSLMRLRPVTFNFKPEYARGPQTRQYGLIAEEVAQVYPELVQYDPKTGQPQAVAYHLVNAMLLNEVQKQHRLAREQEKKIKALEEQTKELSALKEQVRALSALVAQNQGAPRRLSKLDN